MPSKLPRSAAISASRGDLLSARVPSRSKTISFFMRIDSSFLELGPRHPEEPGARRQGGQLPGAIPLDQFTEYRRDSERPVEKRAALAEMPAARNRPGSVVTSHAPRRQSVQDAGTGERIDEPQGVACGVQMLGE